MTQAPPATRTDQYEADFDRFQRERDHGDPAWLNDLRAEAMRHFLETGFPTARRGNEDWKYTNVAPLARARFAYPFQVAGDRLTPAKVKRLVPTGRDWLQIVFLDGQYRPDLSSAPSAASSASPSPGVHAGNLRDALAAYPDLIESHLGRVLSPATGGFTALNTAFLRDGAFVRIPRGVALERPVHLLFLSTGTPEGVVSYPRTLLLLEESSSAIVVETYADAGLSGAAAFTDPVTEISLGSGASLKHHKLLLEGSGTYHVATTRVRQDRDSAYHSTSISMGGLLARNTLDVVLEGVGSRCNLDGLYVTTGEGHVDNHTFIDHACPRASSKELYKGILDGRSRAVFSGRILVRKDAQKTDAHQTNKNLLLSRGAEVDTKPFLEIFADDVQCTHGATAGPVNEGDLFFLRSRGLDEQRARDLLAYAFASEMINRIGLAPIRAHVEKLLLGSLPALHS